MKTTKKSPPLKSRKAQPRKGWRKLFRADKDLLKKKEVVDYIPTKYDETDWVW